MLQLSFIRGTVRCQASNLHVDCEGQFEAYMSTGPHRVIVGICYVSKNVYMILSPKFNTAQNTTQIPASAANLT